VITADNTEIAIVREFGAISLLWASKPWGTPRRYTFTISEARAIRDLLASMELGSDA
jgi:hypothetical protein